MLAAKLGRTETIQALIADGVDVTCWKVSNYIRVLFRGGESSLSILTPHRHKTLFWGGGADGIVSQNVH